MSFEKANYEKNSSSLYCQVIIDRFEKFTGKKAVKL